jgi:hypothetical protein
VVDAKGQVEMSTVRMIRGPEHVEADADAVAFGARAEQTLASLRFEPAQIAGCSIAQLIEMPIVVPRSVPKRAP